MTARAANPQPIAAINITPLIDVLLLLVMMIITLPATTHEIPVDLPQPGSETLPQKVHRLDIAPSGALTLDGAAVPRLRWASTWRRSPPIVRRC